MNRVSLPHTIKPNYNNLIINVGKRSPYQIAKPDNNNFNNADISSTPNISYPMKSAYNTIIPLNIFQTWYTKNLPPQMNNAVNTIKVNNPAFTHYLYDDNDCRNFIKDNFSSKILNAYDQLVPGAYKADLWRYCILYKMGGIYLDIKYRPVAGFKFINLTEKEHWVLDADKNGIYNALLVCLPGNSVLWYAINQIAENVKNRYYGRSSLEPTGPQLLSKYFSKNDKMKFDMYHSWFLNHTNRFIFFNNYAIFRQYDGYNQECGNERAPHYSNLWNIRSIYR